MKFVRRTLHPAWYQGHRAGPPYFEGWYFQLVDATEQHRYAVIPGIFRGKDAQTSHAFVQVLDGTTGQATYHQYPIEAWQAKEDAFDVRIGPNRFTQEHISLQIDAPERTVKGDLRFTGLTPWPVTLTSPGIMGLYAWVPRMECYHGVLSLDHAIHGAVSVNGRSIDFASGRGYIEKDWGRSFPASWVWLQTNHFERPGTSLTGSVATIPWLGGAFRGFIVGLWHERVLYRFATYSGARVEKLAVGERQVEWVVRGRRHCLELLARRAQASVLRGPSGTDMGGRVPETLQATVEVQLWAVRGGRRSLIFEGAGRNAGLEVVGRVDQCRQKSRT
jgi:tocopherol cyclase